MSFSHQARGGFRAFTLIELLVVIGLIVFIAGGFAIALAGRSGEGAALTNAQKILAGLVGAARAQAALHQTHARLVVYAEAPTHGDASKYLRAMLVAREEPFGSGNYTAVNEPLMLPTPICVLPPAPIPLEHFPSAASADFDRERIASILSSAPSFSYRGQSASDQRQFFGELNASGRVYFLEFGPDGLISMPLSSAGVRLALAPAISRAAELPQFHNPHAVRGLLVRRTGAVAMIHDPAAF